MTFLSVVVLSVALATQAQTPEARAEAERLAQSGEYAKALKQFQALAAANPDDIAARMWIARLQRRLGRPERAADVYRSIVAAQPQNIDALVGLGQSLTDAGQFADAADALNRAESIAADKPAVLAAQGHLHAAAGRPTLAMAYYDRALVLDPSNDEARRSRDAMRAERAHRVEGTYYYEHFNTAVPDTNAGTVSLNGHVSDSVRLFGTAQYERKSGYEDARGGGGITWRHVGNLQIDARAMVGSADAVMLPSVETAFDVGYSSGPLRWLVGARYLNFDASSSFIVSPGFSVSFARNASIALIYYRSSTDLSSLNSRSGNSGFGSTLRARVAPRVAVHARYLRGFEGLETITSDFTSQLDANTLSMGAAIDLRPMVTLGGAYEYQSRSDGTDVSAAYANLILRFR